MYQFGQRVSEQFLCLIQLLTFQCPFHFFNLFNRNECQQLQALNNVLVRNIPPVLVKFVWCCLFCIQPNCTLFGLTHFLAFRVQEQGNGHCIGIFSELPANQFRTAEHVCPLVIAAELHVTAVILEQLVEVIALHNHIVEFEECQTPFHPLLVAFVGQHPVDAKASTNFPQNVNIVQVQQPVAIVNHNRLIFGEVNKAAHLLFKAVNIVLNGFLCHHFPHIGLAGRVANHCRTAANQDNWLVSSHLQPLHQTQCHEVSNVQAVSSRVEANVECCFSVVDEFCNFCLIGHLCNQATPFQFFKYCHVFHTTFLKICSGA